MSSKSESKRTTARIARPSTGIEGVNHAVRALYTFKRAATYKELAKPAGLSNVYMSSSLSSARQIGLTKLTGKRGSYELTEAGKSYAMFLTAGKEKECRDLLEETILKNPWWSEIVNFLKINQGKERDILDLVLDIEAKSGKKWSNRMRGLVGNALTSILGYGGLVESKGNKIIPRIGLVEKEEKVDREKEIKKPSEKEIISIPEEFAEFRITDSFILYVLKDNQAIDFFKKQVKENSIFIPWLDLIKEKLKEKT